MDNNIEKVSENPTVIIFHRYYLVKISDIGDEFKQWLIDNKWTAPTVDEIETPQDWTYYFLYSRWMQEQQIKADTFEEVINYVPSHYVPESAQGEICSICGEDASHKVEETIDEPRHPFTAYLCCHCFSGLMGNAAMELCEKANEEKENEKNRATEQKA